MVPGLVYLTNLIDANGSKPNKSRRQAVNSPVLPNPAPQWIIKTF